MHEIRTRTSTILLLAFALASPGVSGHGPGDHAQVTIQAGDSAVAVCQLVVLVNALIVLEAEDTLGLVAATFDRPAQIALPAQAAAATSVADCSVVVDQLSVVFAGAPTPVLARGNHVSGPPPVALVETGSRPGLEWIVDVTGAGSDARVCQVVVILGSIIIGGPAFGIDQSDLPIIDFNAVGEGSGPNAKASCRAAIGEIIIDGVSLGSLEASA